MDPRERANERDLSLLATLEGWQAGIWTAMPGIIYDWDGVENTARVQPAISSPIRMPDGSLKVVQLPLLIHCPVIYPSGGGHVLTFPLAPGDEGLVYFSMRCIDGWWQNGGVQPPIEYRMHDISDGFIQVGVRSQPNVIRNISALATQLRNDAGDTFVEVEDLAKTVTITAPNGATINANVQINGNLNVSGSITAGEFTHTHPDPQGGNTGVPNSGTY